MSLVAFLSFIKMGPLHFILCLHVILGVCPFLLAQLSSEDKQSLLDAHNSARRNVLPSAANMLEMQWNNTLAAMAQSYSEGCVFEHDTDRSDGWPYSIGENLFRTELTISNFSIAVSSWKNESLFYNYDANGCSAICGQYTQVNMYTDIMTYVKYIV